MVDKKVKNEEVNVHLSDTHQLVTISELVVDKVPHSFRKDFNGYIAILTC